MKPRFLRQAPKQYGKIDYQPIINDVVNGNPQLKHIIQVRADRDGRHLNFHEVIEQAEPTPDNLKALAERRPDPDEVSHIMPSGGSAGLPKTSVRMHNRYITNVEYHSRAWESTNNDTIVVITPVGHSMAMHWGIGASLLNFAKLILVDSTDPENICSLVEKERVTAMPYCLCADSKNPRDGGPEEINLTSLKEISLGGAPGTPEMLTLARDKLKCLVINAFGSSEGTYITTRPVDSMEVILGSVGRPACPYDTIKIIDEAGNEVPPNQEGQLVSKGPGIFTGYFKSPEENAEIFTRDGFFKTGDKARRDQWGNITIIGRIKDIINRGGEKIGDFDIENRLCEHQSIGQAAAVGMPDTILGERICAYVTLKPGVTLTFDGIIVSPRGRGASVQRLPERVEFVSALPLTRVGKVDKEALREDIRRKTEG